MQKLSLYIISVTTFLLPVFFIPSMSVSFDSSKSLILSIGILLALVIFLYKSLKDRNISFPKDKMFYLFGFLPILAIISTLVSGDTKSWIGTGIENTTVSFLALSFFAFYLSASLTKVKEKAMYVYTAFIFSFIVIALFQLSRLFFGADFLSFGLLNDTAFNTVGKWTDLGVYFSISAIISFLALQLLSVRKLLRVLLYAVLAISLWFILLVNFTPIWYLLAIYSVLFTVYLFIQKGIIFGSEATFKKKILSSISILSVVVFVLSVVFIFKGDNISKYISGKLGISSIEVRPSWQVTLDIASQTIKEAPVWGAGPNQFTVQYLKYKPLQLNQTEFWGTNFSTGVGYIPTYLINLGLIGLIFWFIFFNVFYKRSVKVFKTQISDPLSRFIVLSSLFISSMSWISFLFYNPSNTILILGSIFTGIFVASLSSENLLKVSTIDWSSGKKKVIGLVLSVILIIASVLWGYVYIKKVVGAYYFQKAANSVSKLSIEETENLVRKALAWDSLDVYYRSIAEVDIAKMNNSVNNSLAKNNKKIDDKTIAEVKALLDDAILNSDRAITYDKENYQNWLSKAKIYEAVIPLQIGGAYENALNAYAMAYKLNPVNPSIYLAMAQMEANKNNLTEAKKYIGGALQLKNNYIDAIYLLSQIQVAEGSIKDAITTTEVMSQINPSNPSILFQIGFLKYNDKDYLGTVDALTKAVGLNPQFSNARYFLGLAQARLGKFKDAIEQFEEIKKFNADNQEVDLILKNLKAGKSPFTDAKNSTPEKRKSPPVSEKK